jgi:hypothetical protein
MPTTALTVSVWVKADSHASSRRIIWNTWSIAGDWIMYSDATNWIFGIKSSGPTDQLITFAHSSDTASWHHLVGTYDGTTQRFYVDGVEVGTALTHTTTLTTGGTFRLSHDAFDTFAGSIDEVRVYSTAITAINVKGLYANPSAVSTSGIITAKSGLIGGFTIGATSITAVSGGNTTTVSSGATAFSAGPTGSPTFTVTQAGALTSTSGAIGGFDIGADYIRDAGNSFGLASTVTGGDDTRFWAGDTFANRATAPFRVTEAGALYATSATISGNLTVKTTFTAGESMLAGDVVYISSTDTVKRMNPDSISSDTIDVTNNTASSIGIGGPIIKTIDMSDTRKVVLFSGGTSSSLGLTYRVRGHNPLTNTETVFFGSTQMSASTIIGLDGVKIDTDKLLICGTEVGAFQAFVITGLSGSSETANATRTIDTTNIEYQCVACAYLSDSHVLFFSKNTSGTASIQFHKCTLSGTTLTASSSGTVSTIGGDNFSFLGARQLGSTNYFIFFIQNTTDAVAQCFVAHYDTGSSTFDSVGSTVDFSGGQDFDADEKGIVISLDDTTVMCAFRTSSTNGKYFVVTTSGTTPTIGTLYDMQSGGGTGEPFCLSKINSRCAFLSIQQNGPIDVRLLELSGDRTTIVEKITVDTNDWVLDTSPCLLSFFQLNPSRYLIIYSSNSTHDFYRESGPYTKTKYPVGVLASTVTSGNSVEVISGGYSSGQSGLTATTSYFADTGGLVTTNIYGADKFHILEAKDTTEAIINIS